MRLLLVLLLMSPAALAAQPLKVAVSIIPLKTLVEAVGGDRVEVISMTRPGDNPAVYNPSPRQIHAASSADLLFFVGVPLERLWLERIRAARPTLRLVDVRRGIELRRLEEHHGHDGRSDLDPHVWTSPPLARRMAATIRDALTEADPAHRDHFEQGFQRLAARIDGVDSQIRKLLAPVKQRRFLVFHPAWGYFADTYGLTQAAVETGGKAPGARALAKLIEQAKAENIRVIFVQPQFSTRLAQRIAQAIGARVATLDPLGPDFLDQALKAAEIIAGRQR